MPQLFNTPVSHSMLANVKLFLQLHRYATTSDIALQFGVSVSTARVYRREVQRLIPLPPPAPQGPYPTPIFTEL